MTTKVLSNAIWNAVNGSSGAVVAVLVPPFLTRLLTPEAYGAWALALQIGTYVNLFGFGVQMAVARFVAYSEAREDYIQRDGIVATAFWFLVAASALGWFAICGVAFYIDRLVPSLSPPLAIQTRNAIILIGFALAVNLPSSVFAAVFTGRQQSDVPAKIQGLGRLILAFGLVAAGFSRNLGLLGLIYAAISIGTVIALWYTWKTRTYAPTLALAKISPIYGGELAAFCFSLTVWNLAMLLVNGLDLLIVGRYDYRATAFYAVSVTLVTLVSGTLSSLGSALVPATAAIAEDVTGAQLRSLVVRSSCLIIGASLLVSAPLIFNGQILLKFWIGERYAVSAAPILAALTISVLIRNAMVPYVTTAIGTGNQGRMTATPLAEGAVSLVLGIIVVQHFGAVGVAESKLFSSIVGVALVIAQHVLYVSLGGMTRWQYQRDCILMPIRSILPITAVGMSCQYFFNGNLALIGVVLVNLTSFISVWFLTISQEDRNFVIAFIRMRRRPTEKVRT